MHLHPRKHPHPLIHKAHQEHEAKLSPIERVAVWASDNLATWQCLTLFTILGAFALYGALFNSAIIVLVAGSISSYFIQLVSLSVIGIGTKVESERNAHVMAKMFKELSDIKAIVKKK